MAASSAQKSSGFVREEIKKVEPLSFQGLPEEKTKAAPKAKGDTASHLTKANNLLAELDREEKSGFNLRESHDDDFDMGDSGKKKSDSKKAGGLGGMNLNGGISKESGDINDNYDDDFDDDIEEDIAADQVDPLMDDADLNARSGNNVHGSGQGITVS